MAVGLAGSISWPGLAGEPQRASKTAARQTSSGRVPSTRRRPWLAPQCPRAPDQSSPERLFHPSARGPAAGCWHQPFGALRRHPVNSRRVPGLYPGESLKVDRRIPVRRTVRTTKLKPGPEPAGPWPGPGVVRGGPRRSAPARRRVIGTSRRLTVNFRKPSSSPARVSRAIRADGPAPARPGGPPLRTAQHRGRRPCHRHNPQYPIDRIARDPVRQDPPISNITQDLANANLHRFFPYFFWGSTVWFGRSRPDERPGRAGRGRDGADGRSRDRSGNCDLRSEPATRTCSIDRPAAGMIDDRPRSLGRRHIIRRARQA